MRCTPLAACLGIFILGLSACKEEAPPQGSDAGSPATEAPAPSGAEATPELQADMNEYVGNLNRSSEIIEEVDSAVDAAAASPQLAPIVDELKSFKQRWDELDEPTRQQLTNAFRDQLEPIVNRLNEQIDQINEDPVLGPQLKELVGEIPLINL